MENLHVAEVQFFTVLPCRVGKTVHCGMEVASAARNDRLGCAISPSARTALWAGEGAFMLWT